MDCGRYEVYCVYSISGSCLGWLACSNSSMNMFKVTSLLWDFSLFWKFRYRIRISRKWPVGFLFSGITFDSCIEAKGRFSKVCVFLLQNQWYVFNLLKENDPKCVAAVRIYISFWIESIYWNLDRHCKKKMNQNGFGFIFFLTTESVQTSGPPIHKDKFYMSIYWCQVRATKNWTVLKRHVE